jgi:hypothetical protein
LYEINYILQNHPSVWVFEYLCDLYAYFPMLMIPFRDASATSLNDVQFATGSILVSALPWQNSTGSSVGQSEALSLTNVIDRSSRIEAARRHERRLEQASDDLIDVLLTDVACVIRPTDHERKGSEKVAIRSRFRRCLKE